MVVYKIKCDTYNQAYINKTKKILIHWIKEHNNESIDSAIETLLKEFPRHNHQPIKHRNQRPSGLKLKDLIKEALHTNTNNQELNAVKDLQKKNRPKITVA